MAALTLALLAAGCAARKEAPTPEPVIAMPAPPPAVAPPVPRKAAAPTPKAPRKAPLPQAKPAVDHGPSEPAQLVGLSLAEVERIAGPPDLAEEKAPAKIWFFATETCSLRVSFFPEVTSLDYRVLSVEVLDPLKPADQGRACMRELRQEARKA